MLELLRALVARFEEWPTEFIVRSHLNDRPGEPTIYPGFRQEARYPEAGVLRQYVSSLTVTAWCDEVIKADQFRPSGGNNS
jgi:hypothetical protein